MKRVSGLSFALFFVLASSAIAFADATMPFVDTPLGATSTGPGFLVRLPLEENTEYGMIFHTDVVGDFGLLRVHFPSIMPSNQLLGRLCNATGKVVKREQADGVVAVEKLELVGPDQPLSAGAAKGSLETTGGETTAEAAFLVRRRQEGFDQYGILVRGNNANEYTFQSADFRSKMPGDQLLGRLCNITGKVVKNEPWRYEVWTIELAQPGSAPKRGQPTGSNTNRTSSVADTNSLGRPVRDASPASTSQARIRELATQYRDEWVAKDTSGDSAHLARAVIQSVEKVENGWHVVFAARTGGGPGAEEGLHIYYLHVYLTSSGALDRVVRGPDALS
jgi:hypothetical protein